MVNSETGLGHYFHCPEPRLSWSKARIGSMPEIDDIVKRLAEVTDQLLALNHDDFAARFKLKSERDGLRAQAAEFHQRKDEGRSTEELRAELAARRKQLEQVQDQFVNRATQASASSGAGGAGAERAIGAKRGGTINNAMRQAQGAGSIAARIAELEQELAKR